MLESNSGSTDRQRWTPSVVVMTSLLISSGPWSHKWRICSFRRILFSLFARLLYWRSRRWNIQPNATRRTPCRRNSSMILTSRYISWWLLRPIMSFSPICTKQTSNFDRFLPRSSCRRWSIVRLPVPWASPEKGRSVKRLRSFHLRRDQTKSPSSISYLNCEFQATNHSLFDFYHVFMSV